MWLASSQQNSVIQAPEKNHSFDEPGAKQEGLSMLQSSHKRDQELYIPGTHQNMSWFIEPDTKVKPNPAQEKWQSNYVCESCS